MIQKCNFRILSDVQKSRYKFPHCENCTFCDSCELLSDYVVKQVKSVKQLPLYERQIWEDGSCPLKKFNQIECGSQWVADGIGDHYKIETKFDFKTEQFKIDKSSAKRNYQTKKWEPCQPVFISAQTGKGKNHFVENVLLKYVRELNHKNKTAHRVLILSNRIALRLQTKDRLERGATKDADIFHSYNQYADVISYQSLLNMSEFLQRAQESKDSNYIFVICDEAHFFTSDAMFNPYTEKILESIINIFSSAVRVYMTATPYECVQEIREKESRQEKYIPGVLYHFKRDYGYMNAKYFSNENTELKDIITNSVINSNEKWLIFIDDKKQCDAFKNLLENHDGQPTVLNGKVLTVSTKSKNKDKKYQEIILNERFSKDINVVIATSVIDNGVNFRDIENVVITVIDRTKCLQMVGRIRVDKERNSKVNVYFKRQNESYLTRRLNLIEVQQDAYHDYERLLVGTKDKRRFLDKYYNSDLDDWDNAKHWFGRDKKDPERLFPNEIARSLANKQERAYNSIVQEMEETDRGDRVTGQKYLQFQLSWFGKEYTENDDLSLNGYKNNGQLEFEKWIHDESLDKGIPKDTLKEFGKMFFEKYSPLFGLCTKKQGFNSDDNRGENGPKTAGYGLKRINEIFQVKNMPFQLVEKEDCYIVIHNPC